MPPNVTVDRVKGQNNTTMLRVKWDPPLQPVQGYDILYRKFEWVYSGRWNLKEIADPSALSSEIIVNRPENSFIVVVQGKPLRGMQNSFQPQNFGGPINSNMGQPNRAQFPEPMMGGQNPFGNGNMQGNPHDKQPLTTSYMPYMYIIYQHDCKHSSINLSFFLFRVIVLLFGGVTMAQYVNLFYKMT